MLSEIAEGRRVKPATEIYPPGDLLTYTLPGISLNYELLLDSVNLPARGTCSRIHFQGLV